MATWAKGVDFKNSGNTARVGGVGIYGTDGTAQKAYLAVGAEPWNSKGLEVTTSAISFMGNKVYHAGSKPTPAEIGAAASSHGTHVTYSTTAPLANGTASAGSASTVARTDHVHPLQTTVSGNAGSATKLATARTINGTSFDGTANITTSQWGTARNITIGSTKKSVNGSADVAWSLSEIGAAAASHTHSYAAIANAVQRWNCGIKCATWSRLLYLTGNTTVGHSFILNIQGTRSSVVFNASFLVNTSHSSVASIVQLNNTKYSNFQIRVVTNSNGEAYVEVYDNASSATNSTTQTLNVSFTALSGIGAGTLTKYTSFTDGSTLASGFTVAHTITTVSGSHYSGNAATATQLQNARTINGTSFNGTANITTANWGTARNIYIADNDGTNTGSAVSVNGSGNATLKLPATIKATLSGNASTSTKATQDSAGQQINTTYIKGLSVSGKTITYTKGDGSTGTITTQDTNTTYSTGTASALGLTKLYTGTGTNTDGTMTQSALKTALDGKAASSHTHSYLPLSGGTLTGSPTVNVSGARYTATNGTRSVWFGINSSGDRWGIYDATSEKYLLQSDGTSVVLNGNASTATTLQTARTINGTSFNGSANITTANWGTARNIYIADNSATNTGPAVSVNGSANATLKLPATIKATLSGNASTATKLATARTISLGGILSGSASFDGSGNITISAAANDITTITKSLNVTTSWADTGITGTNLSTGTYAVQMYVNDGTNTSQYQETYSGIMSWFNGTTSSTDADEILLHKAGHASNGRHVYLRTIRSASSGYLKLQISATNAFAAASSIVFKFKRLI